MRKGQFKRKLKKSDTVEFIILNFPQVIHRPIKAKVQNTYTLRVYKMEDGRLSLNYLNIRGNSWFIPYCKKQTPKELFNYLWRLKELTDKH